MAAGHDKPQRSRGRRTELNRELLAELHHLRIDLDRLVERFELRMGGRLNELIAGLEGDPDIGQKPKLLPVRTAQAMLEEIAGTTIRPKKARPRDFARLEALIRALSKLAPDR